MTIDFKNRSICWRRTWLSGVAQKPIVLRLSPHSRMLLSSLNNCGEWKRDNGIIGVIKKKKKESCININILAAHTTSVCSVRFDSNSHNIEISCLETPLFNIHWWLKKYFCNILGPWKTRHFNLITWKLFSSFSFREINSCSNTERKNYVHIQP